MKIERSDAYTYVPWANSQTASCRRGRVLLVLEIFPMQNSVWYLKESVCGLAFHQIFANTFPKRLLKFVCAPGYETPGIDFTVMI